MRVLDFFFSFFFFFLCPLTNTDSCSMGQCHQPKETPRSLRTYDSLGFYQLQAWEISRPNLICRFFFPVGSLFFFSLEQGAVGRQI